VRKIINPSQLPLIISKIKEENKTIVLAGGVFDVLHKAHVEFLNASKNHGDVLIILLESDESVRAKKGQDRPINDQMKRSLVLSSLKSVDYIVNLKGMTKNDEYDKLMVQIQPDIVAITEGDQNISLRQRQCEKVGAKLIPVIEKIDGLSTTALLEDFENGKANNFHQG
jgi:rfaE bifunctional protein nucleotidyltransferase chain/domain